MVSRQHFFEELIGRVGIKCSVITNVIQQQVEVQTFIIVTKLVTLKLITISFFLLPPVWKN